MRALAATTLVAFVAACGDGATALRSVSGTAAHADHLAARAALSVAARESAPAPDDAPGASDLQHWAVNALLYTILDDDTPPRWTDPEIWAGCATGTEVQVNQRPLVVGEPIPEGRFELSWKAVDCHPLGLDGPAMDGRVTLRLTPWGADRWVAEVMTDGLVWAGAHGHTLLPRSFTARAPMVDAAPVLRP
jgi:hypothetical protein